MIPDVDRVGECLNELSTTDHEYALLYAAREAQKERIKLIKAKAFLEAEGTVAERNAVADSHPDTEQAINDYQNTIADFKLLEARRKRCETEIEVWRTVEASRRRANI